MRHYDMARRRLKSLYRIAISDDLDLDVRYSAARNMQKIREKERLRRTNLDIPADILRILQNTRMRRMRKQAKNEGK